MPAEYVRRQTLTGAERYVTPELKEYEAKALGADERRRRLEYELFEEVRRSVGGPGLGAPGHRARPRAPGRVRVAGRGGPRAGPRAAEHRWRRRVEHPRGPSPDSRGPSGQPGDAERSDSRRRRADRDPHRSEHVREVRLPPADRPHHDHGAARAFVPAREARIGVIDRVFTRVGAQDNLARGQSTFLVEMIETATILNNVTPRSLVLLDEVGRGTSTFDGLAIAWAVVEALHDRGHGAKVLFATHFHELTRLAGRFGGVRNFHVAVREWNDEIVFLHKVQPGGTDRSYGIQVARLAGLPAPVIARSKALLAELEEAGQLRTDASDAAQLGLFSQARPDPLLAELASLDLAHLTPLEALNMLAKWQQRLGGH